MNTAPFRWRFFRAGGFDQVRLDTAAELLAIGGLDQKLWVALSCPVRGIEFDARTLSLIDSDRDDQVREPEMIAAVEWAGSRLANPEVLAEGLDGVPVSAIRDDDEAGAAIAAAARTLLADLGKSEGFVTVGEASAAQARFAEKALAAWEAAGNDAKLLGEATQAALDAVNAAAAKVEDYFVRCRLAAFDDRAGAALNAADDAFAQLAAGTLTADAAGIAALPLARIGAGAALPLAAGVNPAWSGAILALRDAAVAPLIGPREVLSEADWRALNEKLAPYAAWLAARPDPAAEGDGVRELEARYVRDLMPLANNFVAFRDFYTGKGKGTFQIGTLYLDGRACELCVAVNDAAKHAALATLSRICLVYCDCRRRGDEGAETLSIAAAFTDGDSDQLMVGRNGVFYDRQGRDWDATITKIVSNPISIREAFWSPYKKLVRTIEEQIAKRAAAADTDAKAKLGKVAEAAAQADKGKPAETKKKRQANSKTYFPWENFQVGDEVVFPSMNWKRGMVKAERAGTNPEIGPFNVLTVELEDGERFFASGLAAHALNDQPVTVQDDEVDPEEVLQAISSGLEKKIEAAFKDDGQLVRIAGRWFPRARLADVNVGNLNLAEAVLDMSGGEPLPTSALIKDISLPEGINPKLAEFSLNFAPVRST